MIYFHRVLLYSGIVVCTLFFSPPAKSQTEAEISSSEDVAIAFFRTAGANPDFGLWAKNHEEYKRQSETRAADFLFKEKQRLIKRWQDYEQDRDLITVHMTVNIALEQLPSEESENHYLMHMDFEQGSLTYFPFEYQDYKIAVIPQRLEKFLKQEITPAQYASMNEVVGKDSEGTVDAFIQMKPTKSYISQPYMIDNHEQWAMIADIVVLSLRAPSDQRILWNYGADWFVSPVTKELRDLYKTSPGSSRQ
jgi:hypothetical protein